MWMRLTLILVCLSYFVGDCFGCAVAVISFDPGSKVCSSDPVNCNGGGSYDTDDSGSGIVSWKWDFDNDGNYNDGSGENVTFPDSNVGSYIIALEVKDNEGDTDIAFKFLTILEPNELISNKDGTCVECDVSFVLLIDGRYPLHEYVNWSAPGGDPSSKTGGTSFTTHWSSAGSKTVTATVCSTSKSKTVTVAAVTNFSEDLWLDLGNGLLYFEYSWDSSSGDLSDLSGCKVGEKVDFPGSSNPYSPDDPPFDDWNFANPTIMNVLATGGSLSDTVYKAGLFSTPYSNKSFTATQYIRVVKCDDSYTNLMGPLSIVDSVYQSVPGDPNSWKFKAQKSGHSSIYDLP